ncbi:MAG: hypothetical protein ACR2N6_06550, partial [Miltoncostaeaceae bacterium]
MTGRLVSVVVALTMLTVVAFAIPLVLVVESIASGDEERDTRAIAASLAAAIDNDAGRTQVLLVIERLDTQRPGLRIAVFSREGSTFGSVDGAGGPFEVAFDGPAVTRRSNGVVVVDVPNNGDGLARSDYVVRVAAPEAEVGPDLGGFYLALALSALAAVGIAAATTTVAARS